MGKHIIAICQIDCADNRPAKNSEKIQQKLIEAANKGAKLVLFPELSLSGYSVEKEDVIQRLKETTAEMLNSICVTAKDFNVATVIGIFEESPDKGKVYNTSVAVHCDGKMTKYRKMHICPNEKVFYKGADELVVADLGFIKLGLSVCYDNWFPETARMAFLKGADVLHMPFYWPAEWETSDEVKEKRVLKDNNAIIASRRKRMLKVFPARALDNAIYVAMVNHAGVSNNMNRHLPGLSMVFNPYGDLIAEAKAWVEDTLYVEIDLNKLYEWRENTFFTGNHLRPRTYIKAYGEIEKCHESKRTKNYNK